MDRPFQNFWGDYTVGEGTNLGAYCEIGDDVTIGKNCSIQAFCFICPKTVIGDNVFIGPRVTFLNDKYPPSPADNWAGVTVGDGASIGGGAILLPGVTIGKNARIGAGAVVTHDVPDNEVWYGTPAKCGRK